MPIGMMRTVVPILQRACAQKPCSLEDKRPSASDSQWAAIVGNPLQHLGNISQLCARNVRKGCRACARCRPITGAAARRFRNWDFDGFNPVSNGIERALADPFGAMPRTGFDRSLGPWPWSPVERGEAVEPPLRLNVAEDIVHYMGAHVELLREGTKRSFAHTISDPACAAPPQRCYPHAKGGTGTARGQRRYEATSTQRCSASGDSTGAPKAGRRSGGSQSHKKCMKMALPACPRYQRRWKDPSSIDS